MEDIGNRIREERLKRRLTLERFGKRTGLSKSYISQVERGQVNPSVSSLKKIAGQLGISVVQLFSTDQSPQENSTELMTVREEKLTGLRYAEDVRVVRSDRRKRIMLPGSAIEYDMLVPDLNRRMEIFYVRAAPGEHSGEEPLINPPGEKFGLVLKGTVEITVGDEVFILQAGDSIYYPAHFPHAWRCKGDDPIEILWVMTPPSF